MRLSDSLHNNGQASNPAAATTKGDTNSRSILPVAPFSELGTVALDLVAHGLAVLPCWSLGKTPRTAHGVKDATIHVGQIRQWWGNWPDANPAIACGPSGLLVIDADKAGEFERLCSDQGQPVPDCYQVATAKGRHYWFHQPAEPLGGSNPLRSQGYEIDVRGVGGYVMAPGAIHETGTIYTGTGPLPEVSDLPEAPSWLIGMLRGKTTRTTTAPVGEPGQHAALGRELAKVALAKSGGRNEQLNRSAYNLGQLIGPGGLSEGLVRASLIEVGGAAGLEPDEVLATVESGLVKGQANSRNTTAAGDDRLESDVMAELHRIEVRETAKGRWRAKQDPHSEGFDAGTLGEILGREPEPRPRVEGLIPWEASTLVSAQRKTGKTTLVLNLARALLTGEPFLGLETIPVDGNVALLNFEVSGFQIARWANEIRVPHDRLVIVNMRGRRNALADERDRERLAEMLRSHQVESLIVDPFGRAYAGESQNDAGQVGGFLTELDRFARSQVRAKDLILTAHAGWNGERTRGSSALEDWADSIITMTRSESDTSNSARFLRATGRDVDMDEDQLGFDPDTRTLTLTGQGSRKIQQRRSANTTRIEEQVEQVLAAVEREPGMSLRALRAAVKGSKDVVDRAVEEAKARRLVRVEYVGNTSKHYRVKPQEVLPNA